MTHPQIDYPIFIAIERADTEAVCRLLYGEGYSEPGEAPFRQSCFRAEFTDDQLSVTISMWGLIRVLDAAEKRGFVANGACTQTISAIHS